MAWLWLTREIVFLKAVRPSRQGFAVQGQGDIVREALFVGLYWRIWLTYMVHWDGFCTLGFFDCFSTVVTSHMDRVSWSWWMDDCWEHTRVTDMEGLLLIGHWGHAFFHFTDSSRFLGLAHSLALRSFWPRQEEQGRFLRTWDCYMISCLSDGSLRWSYELELLGAHRYYPLNVVALFMLFTCCTNYIVIYQ